VTPGTVTEPALLPGDSNNYLVAVVLDEKTASVSYADITTGEFAVTELPMEALRAELTRLHPAEILVPDNQDLNDGIQGHKTSYPAGLDGREETLLSHFKASTLEGLSAAPCVRNQRSYYQRHGRTRCSPVCGLQHPEILTLDADRRNLELDETCAGGRIPAHAG
jgi:DNA mismatch repair protein MutS